MISRDVVKWNTRVVSHVCRYELSKNKKEKKGKNVHIAYLENPVVDMNYLGNRVVDITFLRYMKESKIV